MIASQIDLDRKPTLAEWLAEDVWFSILLRDVWSAFRDGYTSTHEETERRLEAGKSEAKKGNR